MHLHASWKALFASITAVNEAGDRNVAGFTGAMDLEVSLGEKMTKLVQPFGLLLAANNKKGIAILHHPHNFGGTLLRPSNKVGCLVGVGPSAVPVVLDHDGALSSIAANVLPIAAIADCATVDDLAALPTAPANVDGDFVAAGGGDPTRMTMAPPPMESKAAIAANVGTPATMPPSQATPPPPDDAATLLKAPPPAGAKAPLPAQPRRPPHCPCQR